MISSIFLMSIKQRLVKSFFSSEDFILTVREASEDGDAAVLLTISYTYKSQYFFVLGIYESGDEFNVHFNPGGVLSEATFEGLNRSQSMYKLDNWLSNVVDSIKNEPIARKVMKNEQEIQDIHFKIRSLFEKETEEFFSVMNIHLVIDFVECHPVFHFIFISIKTNLSEFRKKFYHFSAFKPTIFSG